MLAAAALLLLAAAPAGAQNAKKPGAAEGKAAEAAQKAGQAEHNGPKLEPEEAQQLLEHHQRQLKHIEEQRQDASRDAGALAAKRARLQAKLIEGAQTVRQSEKKLSAIEARLQKLRADEAEIRINLSKRHDTIAQMLAVMQRMGRQPPPVMVTRRQDALKMVRSAMLLASFFPEVKLQAEKLSGELAELERVRRRSHKQQLKLTKEQTGFARLKVEIAALITENRELLQGNQTRLAALGSAAARHTHAVENLGDLLGKLDKEVAQQSSLGAYETELKNSPAAELKPEAKKVAFVQPGRMKPAVPFAEAKGLLPMPAGGVKLRGFGAQDGNGGVSKGLLIETREEAQITAPCDGWVIYADRFRSYGQLLIINAGGGYHVLLAGMDHIHVSLGQFVVTGEPVGAMKTLEAPKESDKPLVRPVLYVEFRKDQRPIDPDPWWSAGVEKG